MKLNKFNKFKIFSKLISACFVVFLGILFFVFISLTIKPIKLSSLNFEKSSLIKDFQLDNVGEVYLSFNKLSKNFELLIEDIETKDLKIPNVLLGISIKNILLFKLKPTILKIYDAEFLLDINNENIDTLFELKNDELIRKFVKNNENNDLILNYLDDFEILEINNTQLQISNIFDRNIIFPRVDFKIEKKNNDFNFSGYVENDNGSNSILSFELIKQKNGFISDVNFKNFKFELDHDIVSYISFINGSFHLNGNFSIIFDNNFNIIEVDSLAKFNAKLFKKIENENMLFPIEGGLINISKDKSNNILNTKTKFNFHGSNVDLDYSINSNNMNFIDSNIFIDSIKIKFLRKIWPKNKKVEVLKWIDDNVQGDLIDVQLNLLFNNKKNLIDSYNLSFDFFNGIIKYSDRMPNVTDLNGNANFDGNNFIFYINSGVSEALKLNSAKVLLYDFDKDTEKAIIDLNLVGFTNDITNYLKQTSLNPDNFMRLEKFTGEPTLNLELKFPLLLELNFDDIKYNGFLSFNDSEIKDVFSGVDLKKIQMTIDINDQLVNYAGQGYIENMLVKIEGSEVHNDINKLNELKIALDLEPDFINNYFPGFVIDNYGQIPLNIFYKYNMNNDVYELIANGSTKFFTAYSPLLELNHSYEEGDLSFKIKSDQEKNERVEFLFDSIKFNLFMEILKKNGEINKIVIHRISSPSQDFNASINKNGNIWDANIKGKKINLKEFFKNENENIHKDFRFDLRFNFDVDEITFKEKKINSPKLNGFLFNEKFENLEFRYANDISEHLIQIYDIDQKKQLLVESNNASELFELFDLNPNTKGGMLNINGFRDSNTLEYSGNIMIENFVAYNTPFFTKVLTLFSLDGLEQKLKGGGIYFDTLQSQYTFKNDALLINDGLVRGSDLGLTFQGAMNINKQDFDINGTLIPAYTINTLLTSLPIVGDIITAGAPEEGILAATFSMKKNREVLDIDFNPISVLVPSIIRNFLKDD